MIEEAPWARLSQFLLPTPVARLLYTATYFPFQCLGHRVMAQRVTHRSLPSFTDVSSPVKDPSAGRDGFGS